MSESAGAGKEEGLEAWRIEKLLPSKMPDFAGKLKTGVSYIILKTTAASSGALSHAIHFWLGAETSQDESGIAAYKTIELDDSLGGGPVQYREVQGNESQLFLFYFKKTGGIEYLPGGVESGFRKVVRDVYETRLLHVKGKRTVRVSEVALSGASLNKGDVFILDADLKIYIFNGPEANKYEKAKGIDAANKINIDERNGKAKLVIVNDDIKNEDFWGPLGGFKDPASLPEGESDDSVVVPKFTPKMFRISDSSGSIEFREISSASGKLERTMLESNDVFLVHAPGKMYLWIGRKANTTEEKEATARAVEYIAKNGLPQNTAVERVSEGTESDSFKSVFAVWDRPMAFNGSLSVEVARVEQACAWLSRTTSSIWRVKESLPTMAYNIIIVVVIISALCIAQRIKYFISTVLAFRPKDFLLRESKAISPSVVHGCSSMVHRKRVGWGPYALLIVRCAVFFLSTPTAAFVHRSSSWHSFPAIFTRLIHPGGGPISMLSEVASAREPPVQLSPVQWLDHVFSGLAPGRVMQKRGNSTTDEVFGIGCIMHTPVESMRIPLVDLNVTEQVRKVLDVSEVVSAKNSRKAVLATVRGSGGGKTRLLMEIYLYLLRYCLNVIPIPITYNHETPTDLGDLDLWKLSDECNEKHTCALSVVARMASAFYGELWDDVTELMMENLHLLTANSTRRFKPDVLIRAFVQHCSQKMTEHSTEKIDTFVLILDEVIKAEKAWPTVNVASFVSRALLDQSIPMLAYPSKIIKVAFVVSSLEAGPLGKTLSDRDITTLTLSAQLNATEVVTNIWLRDRGDKKELEISNQQKYVLELCAAALNGLPRLVAFADEFLAEKLSKVPINADLVAALLDCVSHRIGASYELLLPSTDLLYSIVFGEKLLVGDEAVRSAIAYSLLTNCITSYAEKATLVPTSSIMMLAAAAKRSPPSGVGNAIIAGFDAIVKKIPESSSPDRTGFFLEEIAFQWMKIRIACAQHAGIPTSLSKLLNLGSTAKLPTWMKVDIHWNLGELEVSRLHKNSYGKPKSTPPYRRAARKTVFDSIDSAGSDVFLGVEYLSIPSSADSSDASNEGAIVLILPADGECFDLCMKVWIDGKFRYIFLEFKSAKEQMKISKRVPETMHQAGNATLMMIENGCGDNEFFYIYMSTRAFSTERFYTVRDRDDGQKMRVTGLLMGRTDVLGFLQSVAEIYIAGRSVLELNEK